MNEKIKASEIQLTGLNGEDLGIIPTSEALKMAKDLKVDLVCLSLTTSPPPCRLAQHYELKQQQTKERQKTVKAEKGAKVKEIRINESIEDHDYDTKKRQAEKILTSGDAVQLTIRVEGKKTEGAQELAKKLVKDLSAVGKQEKGIQVSGKKIIAIIYPK